MKLSGSGIDQTNVVLLYVLEDYDLVHLDAEALFCDDRESVISIAVLDLGEEIAHELLVQYFDLVLVQSPRIVKVLIHAQIVLQCLLV